MQNGTHVITGSERMQQRPIRSLVDALRHQGAIIEYIGNEGFPPLRITGNELIGGDIKFPGDISSQYITAIMLIAPKVKGGYRIHLDGTINSRPYIDMTIGILQKFGINAKWINDDTLVVPEGELISQKISIEGDWSAASYWFAIAALLPYTEIKLNTLMENSLQGDSLGKDIAKLLGVSCRHDNNSVIIKRDSTPAEYLEYDFRNQPDLAQTYVVLCCLLGTKFKFSGLESLKIKETDRIDALTRELRKIGYIVGNNGIDTMIWDGSTVQPSYEAIDTYKDHRMAMSFAIAALTIPNEITINNPEVVSKSYPSFWNDISSVLTINNNMARQY